MVVNDKCPYVLVFNGDKWCLETEKPYRNNNSTQ